MKKKYGDYDNVDDDSYNDISVDKEGVSIQKRNV